MSAIPFGSRPARPLPAGRPQAIRPDRGGRGWALLAQLLALLLALSGAAPAAAQSFPKFTGFVVDAAGILPAATSASLTAKLDALQRDTGRQLVVATIPDLQGYPIEDYGYRLGRAWAVGLKGLDNGALLIVAPNDRKVRIEVGYGLEGVMTDALSSVIVSGKILPAFRAGDMPGGIVAGTDAIVAQLRLPDAEAKARLAAAVAERDKARRHDGGVPASLVFWGLVLGFVLLAMMRRRGRGGRRFRGGSWPIVMWGPGFGGGGGGSSGGGFFGGGSDGGGGGWMGGGFGGGGGGSFGGGGSSGSW